MSIFERAPLPRLYGFLQIIKLARPKKGRGLAKGQFK